MLRRLAGIASPALLLSALGCGSSSPYFVYSGTGSTQTTGQPNADLGHAELHVAVCNHVRRHFGDVPEYFGAIAIGRGCTLEARQATGGLVAIPGSTCTLHVDGQEHRLRVTDATVTFGQEVRWTKRAAQAVPNVSLVHARIGGDEPDEQGGTRHSLYVFDGALDRQSDADDWCLSMLEPPPQPPRPPSPAHPDRVEEMNGF